MIKIRSRMSLKKIAVIGSGFSGLSSACYLAKLGYSVTIFEKNEEVGGRARMFEQDGFKFDMGPSWYWMPDVFDRFFADFGKKTSDYYSLERLSPGFQIIFKDQSSFSMHNNASELNEAFEKIESGSGEKLTKFLKNAEFKYKISMADLVFKPSHSFLEFIRWDIIKQVFKTNLFSPLSQEVRGLFKSEKLRQIVEFPVIFLGAMADKIPALYSIMNYAAMVQGTYYPKGGMVRIVEAMTALAKSLNVQIITNSPISKIEIIDGIASGVIVDGNFISFDAVVSSADYHHTEMNLLDPHFRNYDEVYWEKKVFAPSSVLFYLGVNKKIDKLMHHNLFFDTDYEAHAKDIYVKPRWTKEPLFYVCCPSKTDNTVAPDNYENIFILIPHAIQLSGNQEIVEDYFKNVIERIEKYSGDSIAAHIVYKKQFTASNFIEEYNSYKGNAYGLANTLLQTAFLKPKLKNKRVNNLFYTGQLTVPGPGVPPAIISGKIVAKEVHKYLSQKK
jgi:phytoene desaturase